MKSSLRSQVAALALLAPLGAAVAQPVVIDFGRITQVQATFGAPAAAAQPNRIDRFMLRADGPIEPGKELRFRLLGAPGGRAGIELPGLARGLVPMAEVRPGVYEYTHVVRLNESPALFELAAVALDRGGQRLIAKVEVVNSREFAMERPVEQRPIMRPIERPQQDLRPPVISALTPASGERVRERGTTEISARLSDEGSGIDRATLVMRVDGRDVTKQVRFNGDEVRFRDDLRDGRHTAELVVRDRAGNVTRRSWTFEVVERGRGYGNGNGYGYGYGYGQNGNNYGQNR